MADEKTNNNPNKFGKKPPVNDKKDTTKGKKPKFVNPEITDKVQINFEPNTRDLLVAMDESFEAIASNDFCVEDVLNEVLSIAGRMRRRQQVRRYKARMQIARRRSMRRRASQTKIASRAKRSAISNFKRKFSGGRAAKQLTYSERARIERLASKRKNVIARNARRLIIGKRNLERKRLSGRKR